MSVSVSVRVIVSVSMRDEVDHEIIYEADCD